MIWVRTEILPRFEGEKLRTSVSQISTYNENGEQYEVHARAVPAWRTSAEAVHQMSVPSTKLGAVSLDNVARFEKSQGPSQVDRLGRRRHVTITANMPAQFESWLHPVTILLALPLTPLRERRPSSRPTATGCVPSS